MQLKPFKNISLSLAVATCALAEPAAAEVAEIGEWSFDTGLLVYDEADSQVQAIEGAFSAKKALDDERSFSVKLVIDSLTGASPNGAVGQNKVQTFTRPSGNGSYTVAAGETPLDDTFQDTRVALSGQYIQQFKRLWKYTGGAYISKEYDYLSASINSALARDFNNRNTTASLGFSYSYDLLEPEGGVPVKKVSVSQVNNRVGADENKQTLDLLMGITQVINRQTLMQFNYGLSDVSGYQTDPFKLVSIIDSNGWAQDYIYESRPEDRVKQSLFWRTKYNRQPSGQVLDVSYRYFWDDWGMTSHTIDTKWRFNLQDSHFIEPHVRYYNQTAVDFYRVYLPDSEAAPEHITADYRLGEIHTYTLGLKYGFPIAGNKFSLRLEYYVTQVTGDNSLAIGPGLTGIDLYPDKSAIMLQSFYRF